MISRPSQSFYVIIRGPLGVGKTTIARELTQRLGARYVSVDTVMTENGLDIVEGEYIPVENFVKVNELVLPRAADALNDGTPVVFDGNFYYERQITHLLEAVPGPHDVFTLHAPLDVCIARDAQRALVYGMDAAAAVYDAVSRVDYGVRIETAGKTVEDILQEIIRLLPSTNVAGEIKMTTIQNVIDRILQDIPGAPLEDTVDTFKSGDPSRDVTGVVTTFLASYDVIQRAAELGANLIITHEPTFYNHLDETDWLADDPVYMAKRALLEEHGIVVWRFHDHWHMHRPDGIGTGVVKTLGWEAYIPDVDMPIFVLPETSVGALVMELKAKLGIGTVRVVGDMDMPCSRVGLMVGAAGGTWQIDFMSRQEMDVLISGEIHEWETCEYVRDAIAQGRKLALIVIGHANSEEAGMAYLVDWLHERFPDLPITHVPVGDPFTFV